MNNRKNINQNRKINVRYIFGIIFPILLSLIPVGISVSGYNFLQQKHIETLSKRWTEKAKLVLNDIRSCWSFEDYLYKASDKFIEITNENLDIDPVACLNKSFTKRMIKGSQIWLFKQSPEQNKLHIIKGKPLQTRFNAAMRKVAQTLIALKENSYISSAKAFKDEKFISGVFGEQSLPKYAARQQEGILTPITFKGENKYLLWLTTGKSGYCLIAVISPKIKIDLAYNLQKTANRIFREYRKQIAVAFCPAKFVHVNESVILPKTISNNIDLRKTYHQLMSKVNKSIEVLESVPYEQKFEKDNHTFLESYITKNNPYNAIIFAPTPSVLVPDLVSYSKSLFFTLFVWLLAFIVFYFQNRTVGLPLKASFRFFFFIVGVSATTFIFLFGQNIINESYSLSLRGLKKNGLSNLIKIDTDASIIVENYYAELVANIDPKTYDILCSLDKNKHQKAFANIRSKMIKKNLALDYLLLVAPGNGSQYFHAPYAQKTKAIEFMDIFSTVTYTLQQAYDIAIPKNLQMPISLTSKQKSIKAMFQDFGFDFLVSLTNNIIERGGFFQLGTMSKTFFVMLILQDNDTRKAYSVFGVNSYRLFRKYLLNKMAYLNYANKNQYASLLKSKDETLILPDLKNKIWQSTQGKNLLSFMRKSMKSSFPIYVSDDNHLYITAPMTNHANSTSGAVISLSEINNERTLKSLINLMFLVTTSLIIYLISSFITSYILSPLNSVNDALTEIYNGSLHTKLKKIRNDELGTLTETINTMQKGLIEKQKLGKFVSTVFSDALSNSSIDQLKAGISFTGTILFSDIRSFTTMSEQHSPNIIANMLNTHLSNLAKSTHKFGGQVEQFIGDAIVAVFPDKPGSEGHERALKAAQDMMVQHNKVQAERTKSGSFTYAIGIGLDHGRLIAGSLITDERAEFTVIGLPRTNAEINEAASKDGSYTKIIISSTIFQKLTKQHLFTNVPLHIDKYELVRFSSSL